MNNGYCSITIDGQKVGIKFGMPAIRQFGERLQKSNLMTDDSYNELGIAHIIYAGYCCNCEIKLTEPVIEFEKFYSFVEESLTNDEKLQVIKDVVKCWEESQYVKQVVDNLNNATEELKKKSVNGRGKKSKVSATENLASSPPSTGT